MTRRAFLAGALASASASEAFAQGRPRKKMALVIGNGDYDGDGRADSSPQARTRAQERGFIGDLPNAWFDAVRVGEALRGAGFEVQTFNNADRTMISGAVATHQTRAAAAGPDTASIIYYAGHGIQLGGRNYLVGVRAQLLAADMPFDTAEARERVGQRIGAPLQNMLTFSRAPTAPGYTLILIDACRDNPWEETIRAAAEVEGRRYVGERGFGAMSAPQRTIICFSAQPGQLATDGMTAASSPFANALSRRLKPGAVIDDMLTGVMGEVGAATAAKQTPWIRGRLGDGTAI